MELTFLEDTWKIEFDPAMVDMLIEAAEIKMKNMLSELNTLRKHRIGESLKNYPLVSSSDPGKFYNDHSEVTGFLCFSLAG